MNANGGIQREIGNANRGSVGVLLAFGKKTDGIGAQATLLP